MTKQELKNKLLATNYFINNNYLEEYLNLVFDYKLNNPSRYTEEHHILQKQYFRLVGLPIDNSKLNLVSLLYKDHCKAHWLLYYCTKGNLKRANAAAVNYIVKVYNSLHLTNKTKEDFLTTDFEELQCYYDAIKNDTESKYYTDIEIKFLQENYPKQGSSYCAKILGRTRSSVMNTVNKLGLSRKYSWTEADCEFLKENYALRGGKYCAEALGKTLKDVFKKAMRLGLSREKTPKVKEDSWREAELLTLTTYYPKEGTKVYLRIPTRSYNACRLKASQLGLKKEK